MNPHRLCPFVIASCATLLLVGCATPKTSSYGSFFGGSNAPIEFATLTPSDEVELNRSFFLQPYKETATFLIAGLHVEGSMALEEDGLHVRTFDPAESSFYRIAVSGTWEVLMSGVALPAEVSEWIWSPDGTKVIFLRRGSKDGFSVVDLDNRKVIHSDPGTVWAGWLENNPVFWNQAGPNSKLGINDRSDWQPRWLSGEFSPEQKAYIITTPVNGSWWPHIWGRYIFFQAAKVGNEGALETWALDPESGRFLFVGLSSHYRPLGVNENEAIFWHSQESIRDYKYPNPVYGLVIAEAGHPVEPIAALPIGSRILAWPDPDLLLLRIYWEKQFPGDFIFYCRFAGNSHTLTKLNIPSDIEWVISDGRSVWTVSDEKDGTEFVRYDLPEPQFLP